MTHVHDHGGSSTTVIDTDRGDGPATALIVLIALVIIGALIWFFAFSGVVFHRNSGDTTNLRINNPPAQQNNNNTNTNPGSDTTGTQPSP